MKVLAIMGSPKGKGNTYKVTKKVEESMKKLGNVKFEYLFLKDVDLKPCKGCLTCILKDEDLCPLKDDRVKIEEMIMDANGVILSSPTYVMQVTLLMTILVDRLCYLFHRPRFFNQKAMEISTSGGVGLKETLNYLEMVAEGLGVNFVNKLGIGTPKWPITLKTQKKNKKKVELPAENFTMHLNQKNFHSES